jgi:hypothetical protein
MNAMKNFLLSVMIVLFCLSSNAQREYIIDTDDRMNFYNINLGLNGGYIAVFNLDSLDWNYRGGILKFDDHFNYEMYIHGNDSTYFRFFDFVVTDDNHYLIGGSVGDNTGWGMQNKTVYFLLLDENLNVLNETFFPLPEPYKNPTIRMFTNTDGRIYATIDEASNGLKGVLELSSGGEILREKLYPNTGSTIMDIFPGNEPGFYLFRSHPVAWARGGITVVDADLNFDTTYLFPMSVNGISYRMGTRGNCKWLNDTAYILASEGKQPTAPTSDLHIYKINSNHEFLTEPFIIGRDEFHENAANFRCLDWHDPQIIYVAGFVWASNQYATPGYVAVINEEFDLLGWKSIGGDYNIGINSIVATPDGRCVMVGSRRDYHAGIPHDLDGYVVFLHPEDIITSVAETGYSNMSDYSLFPNPGADILNIQTARKGVTLHIYDRSGRTVLQQKLEDAFHSRIDVAHLPAGFYICQVTDKYGFTEHIKWIKKQ